MTDPEDPRLRVRCWIDGQLVDEVWLDASNPDADQLFATALARHMARVRAAEVLDQVWMVETYDPAKPDDQAYERIGTDANGMVNPRPLRKDES